MSCERTTSDLPGEAAAGKEFAQGGDHPSPPSLTPHFAHLRRTVSARPAPLQLSSPPQAPETTTSATFFNRRLGWCSWAQSAAPKTVRAFRPSSLAFSIRAVRASCRLRQLRCWVAPGRDSSSSASSVRRVPSLRSSVSLRLGYTRLLFLQALQASACESVKALLDSTAVQRHRHFLGSSSQSLPGVRNAAVPAAGADSVGTSPPQTAPVGLCLAAYAAANVVLLFGQVSRPGSVR